MFVILFSPFFLQVLVKTSNLADKKMLMSFFGLLWKQFKKVIMLAVPSMF